MIRLSCMAVLAFIGISLPAVAQEDPMDLQRCIWRCLADHGPASDPAYHACVEQYCHESVPPAAQQPAPQQAPVAQPVVDTVPWQSGVQVDGQTAYAGRDLASGQGGFYYLCNRHGTSSLGLWGVTGESATLRLDIDGRVYDLWFQRSAQNWFFATAPQGAPVLAALYGGRTLTVRNSANQPLMELGLTNAPRALSTAFSNCR